jgi:hypothetical protein
MSGRRWPRRPSRAPSRCTRRAGRTRRRREVREALRYLGNLNWKTSTDPDPYHEPLLDVSRIATLGTFDFKPAARRPERRGRHEVGIPVAITRARPSSSG